MKLTRNFRLSEFTFSQTATRKGIDNSLPLKYMENVRRLAIWLQTLRDRLARHYGKEMPIVVTSGYRCRKLNRKIGGSSTSLHKLALAADIIVPGLSPTQLQRFIMEQMQDCPYEECIDEYDRWVHIAMCVDGDIPQMENLRARKRFNWRGKLKTQYEVV